MPLIDGVVSGLDTSGLISAISSANQSTLAVMQAGVTQDQNALGAVTELSGLLGSLSEAITALGTMDDAGAVTASLSQEGAFTVNLASGAPHGTYTVDVQSLAKPTILSTMGFSDSTTPGSLPHGTVDVTIGDTTVTIVVDATNDSLTGLAESISEIEGVTAYVLDTGDPDDPYQMIVRGENTGEANAVSVSPDIGMSLGIGETQAAEDGVMIVDGVLVQSGENLVEVAPGMTLDLQSADIGPVDITVGVDSALLEEQIQTVVDAYNSVVEHYDTQNAFDLGAGIRGGLVGDSTSRRVVDGLGLTITDSYDSVLTGVFTSLAQLGVSTQQDGTLEFDPEILGTAIATDLDSVLEVLTLEGGPLGTLRTSIDDVYIDEDNGLLSLRTDSLESMIEDAEERISAQEDLISAQEDLLRARFVAMEQAIAEIQAGSQYLYALMPNQSML
jgi:flagellar hook-associated protein 2